MNLGQLMQMGLGAKKRPTQAKQGGQGGGKPKNRKSSKGDGRRGGGGGGGGGGWGVLWGQKSKDRNMGVAEIPFLKTAPLSGM